MRVRWLLEELAVPYELRRVAFHVPKQAFAQDTPLGKLPVIEDGAVTICESGAIVQYVLEQYGAGFPRLTAYLARLEARPAFQRAAAD